MRGSTFAKWCVRREEDVLRKHNDRYDDVMDGFYHALEIHLALVTVDSPA